MPGDFNCDKYGNPLSVMGQQLIGFPDPLSDPNYEKLPCCVGADNCIPPCDDPLGLGYKEQELPAFEIILDNAHIKIYKTGRVTGLTVYGKMVVINRIPRLIDEAVCKPGCPEDMSKLGDHSGSDLVGKQRP